MEQLIPIVGGIKGVYKTADEIAPYLYEKLIASKATEKITADTRKRMIDASSASISGYIAIIDSFKDTINSKISTARSLMS